MISNHTCIGDIGRGSVRIGTTTQRSRLTGVWSNAYAGAASEPRNHCALPQPDMIPLHHHTWGGRVSRRESPGTGQGGSLSEEHAPSANVNVNTNVNAPTRPGRRVRIPPGRVTEVLNPMGIGSESRSPGAPPPAVSGEVLPAHRFNTHPFASGRHPGGYVALEYSFSPSGQLAPSADGAPHDRTQVTSRSMLGVVAQPDLTCLC